MPKPKLTDEIELHGLKFRIHRITGIEAFEAKAEWAGVAGERGAHILALGEDQIAELAEKAMTYDQREAFEGLGESDGHRFLALIAVVMCMQQGRMTGPDMRRLVDAFILGHVELLTAAGPVLIETTQDLDTRMDGSKDGQVWNDLLWQQIPHCLGPTIAVGDTSPGTQPTAQT